LEWNEVFEYVGFPSFLKPHSGGGWKHVYKIHNEGDFFHFYHQTGELVMTLQEGIEFNEYFRCYCIGQEKVHIMRYDPKQPFEMRYVKPNSPPDPDLEKRIVQDCLTICQTLGYDMNTVEFAVRDGIPYAIDFLNPAPDAVQVAASRIEQDVKASDGESLVKARGKPITAGEGNGKLSAFHVKNGDGSTKGASGNGMMIKGDDLKIANAGGAMLAGKNVVDWGTWKGESVSVNGMATQGGVHFISTSDPTQNLAALGPTVKMASYSYTNGMGVATNNEGTVATIKSLDVKVDFSTQQVTQYQLQAQAVGNWNVNGSGSVAAFTGTSGIALQGNCDSCSGGSMGVAAGTAHGTFVGPQAEGLITSFGLTSAGKSLSGAAYLTRPNP